MTSSPFSTEFREGKFVATRDSSPNGDNVDLSRMRLNVGQLKIAAIVHQNNHSDTPEPLVGQASWGAFQTQPNALEFARPLTANRVVPHRLSKRPGGRRKATDGVFRNWIQPKAISFLGIFAVLCGVIGCSSIRYDQTVDYLTPYEKPMTASIKAAEKHRIALALLAKGELEGAESATKEALASDNSFGPAHNTLGTVFFEQGKFYPAAWEFEYARRLMPNRPEPLNNIGLVYEKTLRLDDAVEAYSQAMAFDPNNPEYLGNLVRTQIKRGVHPSELSEELQRLISLGPREEWAIWARSQLLLESSRPSRISLPTANCAPEPFGDIEVILGPDEIQQFSPTGNNRDADSELETPIQDRLDSSVRAPYSPQ